MAIFTTLRKRPLKNILGQGENAGSQHFLLFPQCFLPQEEYLMVLTTLNLSFAIALSLDNAKVLSSGKS